MITSAHPAYTETIELRIVRQVCPSGWIRMLVSRPTTVVVCGAPERTSLHIGWLLSGCVICRCCCCEAYPASTGFVAGDCSACACGLGCACAPAAKNSAARSVAKKTKQRGLME